jgi:hypothetical protein
MYCDRCGSSIGAAAQFCSQCGKTLAPGLVPVKPPAAVAPERRVQGHIQLLAGLWLANGVLRLLGIGWMMIAGRLFFPFSRGWDFPFGRGWPFFPFFWGGLFSAGIFLAFFGILHLVLAWGLFERQPWARTLGIVIGFLALFRIPLGTVLGAYTLWVLLPGSSAREYDQMAAAGGQLHSARSSS